MLPPGSPALKRTAKGEWVLSESTIDLFRKLPPGERSEAEFLATMQEKLERTFQTQFTKEQVLTMNSYINAVDLFSPGFLAATRDLPDLATASYGVVSIDFAGLGAKNMSSLMDELTRATTAEEAMEAVGRNRKAMGESLQAQKALVHDSFKRVTTGVIGFSGDDGLGVPTRGLTVEDKTKLVQDLGRSEKPSDFRMTFVPPHSREGDLIAPVDRGRWIGTAEGLEKNLRQMLTGKISSESQRGIAIAVDLRPTSHTADFSLKGADVSIYVGGNIKEDELATLEKLIKAQLEVEGVHLTPNSCFMYVGPGRCITPQSLAPPKSGTYRVRPRLYGMHHVIHIYLWPASKSSLETQIRRWPNPSPQRSELSSAIA